MRLFICFIAAVILVLCLAPRNTDAKHRVYHSRCETLRYVRDAVDLNGDRILSRDEMDCARPTYLSWWAQKMDKEVEDDDTILSKCDMDGDGFISEFDFYNSSNTCLHEQSKLDYAYALFGVNALDKWAAYGIPFGNMAMARAQQFPICGPVPKDEEGKAAYFAHLEKLYTATIDNKLLHPRARQHFYEFKEGNTCYRLDGIDCYSFETDPKWIYDYPLKNIYPELPVVA
jgi:hypothetical protein